MVDKNHRSNNEKYTKWSIRRLSVGVASVVVASGFFILISNPVNAQVGTQNKVVTTAPSNSPTDSGKSILDSKVGQSEKTTADKKETPDATKPSQDLSGRTTQTPDKKVQEKQEVTKENKVGKSIAEAAKKIQKASETVVKEATPKAQEDPSLAQSVSDSIKGSTDVPASFLANATHPGPFTAGVNEVIPYELFGGDGMLTRLLLKSSNGAPWSDNGTAKHAGLLPFANIPKGKYFYQVSLNGNAAGKQGKVLLDQLKANGTHSYTATVTVYGATKDGKADLNNVIATRQVNLNLNGTTTVDQVKKSVVDNIKDKIDVPASYLKNAVFPGPFTAGVNQVIPYELFGGDGMLTRLLLKSSNGAPWSDNGSAKHPGLLPLAGLGKGQYFYQVSLDGNAAGKQDKALLEQLKANGTHLYKATVTVYGATKDGKADLKNVIATKSVTINLKGEKKADSKGQSQQGQNDQAQNQGKKADYDGSKHSNKGGTPSATSSKGGQATASKKSLPNTGQKSSLGLTVLGLLGLSAAAILALVGMKRREKK